MFHENDVSEKVHPLRARYKYLKKNGDQNKNTKNYNEPISVCIIKQNN